MLGLKMQGPARNLSELAKMIDHVWTVFCTRSVIDKDTNNVSLFEVIEKISAAGKVTKEREKKGAMPAIPLNAQLVTLWARQDPSVPESGRARIIFESPSQKVLFQFEYEIDLSSFARTRSRGSIATLPVPESGWYKFRVQLLTKSDTWQEVACIPLEVEVELKESHG
jgi:hypothetical protein